MSFASRLSTETAFCLDAGEGWLRPADRLDYFIRRSLIPIRFESQAERERVPRNNAILREIQTAIGRGLRAEYDLGQPIPARLVLLLREFERNTAWASPLAPVSGPIGEQ